VIILFRVCALAVVLGLLAGSPAFAAKNTAPPVAASSAPSAQPTDEPPSSAIPRLENKLKNNPNDVDTMTDLSRYYLNGGRPDLALSLTHRLLSLGTKSPQAYYLNGVALEQVGHLDEATASLVKASDLDPANEQILFTLTDVYLRGDRTQDAERVAKRATAFNANDKRAFLNYGLAFMQEQKFDQARAQFETAAKLDPKDATPIVLEARSYEGQNASELASAAFDRAIAVDPKSFDAHLGKAHLQASLHEIKEAIESYEATLPYARNDEERVGILDEEASAYMNAKMLVDAENVLKRSVASFPKSPAAHLGYGDFYAAQRKFAAAEAEWKLALGPNNDYREAFMHLGDYYVQSDQGQKAVEMYKHAVELNPTDPQALAQLGQAFGINRQFSQAREAYRHSFAIMRTPQALAGIGASDYQLKSYKEGAAAFDALNDGASQFLKATPQLYYVMGKLYTGNHEKAKAKAAYKQFLAYVKPGTPIQAEVKKLIASLEVASAPSKPSAKPKAQ
jgi:tetratricopeptide (TPR) repeat protein